MSIRACAVVNLGTIALVLAMSESSLAQLVKYDDFSLPFIDPAKWTAEQGFDPDLREGCA